MKKLISPFIFVLVMSLLLCAVGCGGDSPASSLPSETSSTSESTTENSVDQSTTITTMGLPDPNSQGDSSANVSGTTSANQNTKTTTESKVNTVTTITPSISGNKEVDAILKKYTEAQLKTARFELDKYMQPIWDGDIVYNESVMVVSEADGSIAPITLAYDASYIVEVRNARLDTVYTEGKDYCLENGKLVILKGGNIPVTPYKEFYPDTASDKTFNRTDGGYLLFSEGSFFHDRQIAVTYVHLDEWKGETPAFQGSRLKKTIAKLEAKQPVHIVIYGASVSTGANSSGTQSGGFVQPFMPGWFEMMVRSLKKAYGYNDITYANPSVGGKTSVWGKENAQKLVASEKPDLVIIGFGNNDRTLSNAVYRQNREDIMNAALAVNPNCEFIVTSPIVANKDVAGFGHNTEEFTKQLKLLCGNGVALMDVTSVHQYLLTRKNYRDMTGNNVNHPNDFLCRVYAQVALSCLVK